MGTFRIDTSKFFLIIFAVSFTNFYPRSGKPGFKIRYLYSYFMYSWAEKLRRYSDWLRAGRSGERIPVVREFPPVQTGPGAHPASCTMRTGSFPGVNYGRGVLLTTHPLLVPRSWKSRAIALPTLWATIGPVTLTRYLTLWRRIFFYFSTSVYKMWITQEP
jgi:hypothetical protein